MWLDYLRIGKDLEFKALKGEIDPDTVSNEKRFTKDVDSHTVFPKEYIITMKDKERSWPS